MIQSPLSKRTIPIIRNLSFPLPGKAVSIRRPDPARLGLWPVIDRKIEKIRTSE
jgi:hypothetical protein